MKKMKKTFAVMALLVLIFSLAACGSSAPKAASTAPAAATQALSADAAAEAEHSDVLVAYFSATGTTKGVAEKIAAVTGGDLYEILAADPYTAEDLNYNDRSRMTRKPARRSAVKRLP